jgi:hypothetical protein
LNAAPLIPCPFDAQHRKNRRKDKAVEKKDQPEEPVAGKNDAEKHAQDQNDEAGGDDRNSECFSLQIR